jgi:nitric oxide reductase NorQ protein
VISFNPGYQHAFKDLKQSTRQRFVALDFTFPPAAREAQIVQHESSIDPGLSHTLVDLAQRLRALHDQGLAEVPSTRLLVATARLIAGGIPPRQACYLGLVAPLSDDPTLIGAMRDLVAAVLID